MAADGTSVGGVDIPLARALVEVASALLGSDLTVDGLTAARLGIVGLDRDNLLALVRGAAA